MHIKQVFLFLWIPLLLIAEIPIQEQYRTHVSNRPASHWVTDTNFTLEPETIHPSQVNKQSLLLDTQYNLEEKTHFSRRVIKILSQAGVDYFSQLRFDFNPSYQDLVMHKIQIYRDGQWSDRLNTSTYKLVQRESWLDWNIYNGYLCLVYFLDDIRPGDIIDYSYSIIGENPVYASHLSQFHYFQETDSVEKVYLRILGHLSQELYFKNFNIAIEPKITVLAPNSKEWVWETSSMAPYIKEEGEPSWYNYVAGVQITQYKNWHEVVEKQIPLYFLPKDLRASCFPALIDLTNIWQSKTDDPIEQATLALRFVQDEIRYQGFEDGIGAFQPTDPEIVLERRFGDCKDKSFLLHTLLKIMNIESTPLLVHTSSGKNLPNYLPSPYVFNHVVLKISIHGETYWIDPTISLQGGSLIDNYFPDYYWGLCISEETNDLVQLPQEVLKQPIAIETSITVKTPDIVEMTTEITLYGKKADDFRRYVATIGAKNLSEETLMGLKKKYRSVAILSPISISDNRKSNVIVSKESFIIPTRTRSGKKVLKTDSFILANCLDDNITMDRSAPYDLYPIWAKERVKITNPYINWSPRMDELKIENPVLNYFFVYSFEGGSGEMQFEIKHLKNHIPVDLMNDYWDAVDEIKSHHIDEINIYVPT